MAAATILHVGDDICHRIPVMEKNGLVVVRVECSVGGVRSSFVNGDIYSAVTFHNDTVPLQDDVIAAARELSHAPLVLFENTSTEHDEEFFDLVIPALTSPMVWSKTVRQAISESRECNAIRCESQGL